MVVNCWQAYVAAWRGMKGEKNWWATWRSWGPSQLTRNANTGFKNVDHWQVYTAARQWIRSKATFFGGPLRGVTSLTLLEMCGTINEGMEGGDVATMRQKICNYGITHVQRG